jgi:microcystin-dependent protein
MALAQTSYPSAGVGPYTIPFPYLVRAHVEVLVNGALQTQGAAYTFPTASSIQFTAVPAPGTIVIRRNSSQVARLTNYQDGSKLGEQQLDFDVNQAFFVAQEALDEAELAIVGGAPASAGLVAVVAAGNLASTNVQAALLELQGDVDTLYSADAALDSRVAVLELAPSQIPVGTVLDWAGLAAPPSGYLDCNGSAVSRTTYSALFSAIGTAYGSGDGSTTFNLPDFRGRVSLGQGTGTLVDTVSGTASSNAVPVASNADKWITGMEVTVSAVSGFTGVSNGSYFVIRVSSTSIRLATTLANAQNGTAVTITGTGSFTLTHALTPRTLGDVGGQEAHAMSSTELLLHTHVQNPHLHAMTTDAGIAGSSSVVSDIVNRTSTTAEVNTANATATNQNTGGNAAANVMQPYLAVRKIIKT